MAKREKRTDTSTAPFAVTDWPGTRVEQRKTSALKANPNNARTHPPAQIEHIRKSIKEFGFTIPILIDEHDTVLAGHARLEAVILDKIEEVPVIVARGWSEKKKRAYIEADNRLSDLAGWDEEARRRELAWLSEQGFPMEAIGWEGEDLAAFLKGAQAPGEFARYGEDIPTEHECPQCHYRWSGKYAGVVPAEKADEKRNGGRKAAR